MSRIEQAIRRIKGLDDKAPADPAGELFKPAWPEAETRPEKAEAAPKRTVLFSSKWRTRLAEGSDSDPVLAEQFRRLAATLHQTRQTHPLRSVMVTSADPGDGKTLTAVNLALVLAETYRYSVLLVDADLRRPAISNILNLPEGTGLSDALRAPAAHKLALAPLTSRLTLLPAGRPIPNPIEALVSPRMRTILEEASANFDWVILDAPPVGPTTDARLLSQMVGGTLFVIRAGKTQHQDVVKSIETVGRDQILGVVLNDVEVVGAHYYYAEGGSGRKR